MTFLKKFQTRGFIQIIFLLSGILFLAFGVFRGEVKTIIMKAIYICLECIGIG